MIEFNGKPHTLYTAKHNSIPDAYLVDGKLTNKGPHNYSYMGYIRDGSLIIEVYQKRHAWLLPCIVLLLFLDVLLAWYLAPTETELYPASFASAPIYQNNTLYCYVVNVSDREITVSFVDGFGHESISTLLRPQETLPYITLDFVPSHIVYDGNYYFKLEAQYE